MSGRFPIMDVSPAVESGRRPAKAAVGELITIEATVVREGHDALGVDVVPIRPDGSRALPVPMVCTNAGLGRYSATIRPDTVGRWGFTIEAWSDPYGTWTHRAEIKVPAGIDVELELEEGARVLERAAEAMPAATREPLLAAIAALRNSDLPEEARLAAGTGRKVAEALARHPLRDLVTPSGPWPLFVDRRRALFGSWYEFFPRSEGATATTSGTFADATKRLDAIAAMGFDIVYLPPIHPIGETNRKGANNTLEPGPHDPGSPWAIGSADGGHDTVHPDLGTLDDFDAFVARTAELGMEVALDFALQATPDHPWATSGKPWFQLRADGSIAYAENPPKKYQDIYPIWFDGDPEGLHREALRILRFWMDRGVRVFRVDNPHTKPVRFWDRLLGEIRQTDPDVLFLAEAFTKPPMMRALAEVGFHQSYTYFTWRNAKWELEEYLHYLAGEASAYMRPNFFANTPDILHAYLQYGGRGAFAIRATLAATLSPTYGIYSGFELFEHVAVKPGSEEYLDTEKFSYRPRDYDTAEQRGDSLAPYLTLLNDIRRRHPALQQLRDLTFHHVDDENIIAFSKSDGDDTVIVVCTLDPHAARETTLHLNMPALGMEWHESFRVRDEVTDTTFLWREHNFIRLDPHVQCAHILHLRQGAA
ncbi:MAG: alpha-1,4-glucan--maltose-1-phosphate maltosyltransferase [Actinobacteria bacterium]|nr:alpha-1,4-glucan--maltose-1-phosphate maltosyltransferase [Actinomycetota bacterium]